MKIHIKNGRLVDPAGRIDAKQDVFIADGKIAALGRAPAGFSAKRVIDATGLVVCPGLVDLSARLREPGFEYKATLESEMQAAVAGGVTSLACPPDTDPPLDEPGLVEMLKHRARSLNLAHVYPLGALTLKLAGERLTEMAVLRDAGCVAFSQADTPIPDTQVLWRAMQYASTFGFAVWLRPQDGFLAKGGVAHDGEVATRLGLPGIPAFAETIAIATIIELVRATGTRVHLCRLSTAEGVAMVRAREEGRPAGELRRERASRSPVGNGPRLFRFALPRRPAVPVASATATRCARASPTAPSTRSARTTRRWTRTPSSCPSPSPSRARPASSCCLPLALKWAEEMRVALPDALATVTSRPAAILGIEAGTLAAGRDADVCVFDPEDHVDDHRRSP